MYLIIQCTCNTRQTVNETLWISYEGVCVCVCVCVCERENLCQEPFRESQYYTAAIPPLPQGTKKGKVEDCRRQLQCEAKGRTLLVQRKSFDLFLFQKPAALPHPFYLYHTFQWPAEVQPQRFLFTFKSQDTKCPAQTSSPINVMALWNGNMLKIPENFSDISRESCKHNGLFGQQAKL